MPDRFDDQINDFWNEIVSSGDAGAGSLDPRLAGAIEQVHTLSQAPIPDSARERIRRKVLDQSVSTEGATLVTLEVAALPLPNPNGRTASAPTAPRKIAPARRPLTRMQWAMLAAAVLIFLGAVGGFFASGGSLNNLFGGDAGNEPNPIPAATVESSWPQFRGGPTRTGYSSDPGPGGDLDLRWTFTADEVLGAVVSQGSSVYVYGRKGDLFALNALTGAQRWVVDLSTNEYTAENRYPAPAVADDMIYAGTFDGALVALSTDTGEIAWQRSVTTQPLIASPAVAGGVLYVAIPEGSILAIDPATGATTWEWTGDSAIDTGTPAVGGDHLYISNIDGDLVAIDIATGQTAWIADLNQAHRVTAYRDGVVYTAGLDGRYYALDAATGAVKWTSEPLRGEQTLNPVVTPKLLIGSSQRGVLQALDLATGELVWSVDGPGSSSSPHASSGAVYVKSPDDTEFVAYDLETGTELGRAPFTEVGGVAAISGNTLVLSGIGDQGVIRSVGPGAGAPNAVVASLPAPLADTSPVAASPEPQFLWASNGDGNIGSPTDIAMLPDGNVAVAGGGQVVVLSPDGAFVGTIGSQGTGDGQFVAPASLAVDSQGSLSVTDSERGDVQKFDPDGTFLLAFGSTGDGNGEFQNALGIAADAEDNLYIADGARGDIQKFDSEGNYLMTFSAPGKLAIPTSPAIDAQGHLWVAELNNHLVHEFAPDGTYLGAFGTLGGAPGEFAEANAVTIDAGGNFYVSDATAQRVHVFDGNWTYLYGLGSNGKGDGQFLGIFGTEVDGDGNIYVTDTDNGRIQKFHLPDTSANSVATVAASTFDLTQVQLVWESSGSPDHPMQVPGRPSIGPDGTIYVPSIDTSTIEIFAKDGTYIESWGKPGSGPGQFENPQALDFDADGNIYVFDTGNTRVQKFAPDRTFLLEWGTKGTGDGQFEEVNFGVVDRDARLIYASDFVNNRIQVFDLDGNFVEAWGSAGNQPGQFVHPTVITLDADGNLWVGEQANGSRARVQKFDPHGNYLSAISADGGLDGTPYRFTEVWGLAFDAQGNLFVSDYWTNTVVVFDADFNKIGEIQNMPSAGSFNVPLGLTFDDEGYLYVADGMNNRVLKLELPPIG